MSGSRRRALVRTAGDARARPAPPAFPAPRARALSSSALLSSDTRGHWEAVRSQNRGSPRRCGWPSHLARPPGPAQRRYPDLQHPDSPSQAQPALVACLCKAASSPGRRIGSGSPKATHAAGQDTPCWVSLIFSGKPGQVLSPVPALPMCSVF